MQITWLGHSAFEIEDMDHIVVDPFITGNPMAPKRWDEVKCDIIALTHGHGDHVGDTIEIARKNNAVIVAIHEIAQFLAKLDLQVESMNKGATIRVKNTDFSMTHAIPSSGISGEKIMIEGGAAAGYVMHGSKVLYHAGDTALFKDMELIAELYKPEIAFLPIGDRFTMGIKEAAMATKMIAPRVVIPMHYNTFPLVEQDPFAFKEAVESMCPTEVVILNPGDRTSF
ncbi:MAG: metal-dependent hydrolase [Thermoplasmata archaeon]|nr:metal-dependent hydrolase [Thermoplasmata archaeon]